MIADIKLCPDGVVSVVKHLAEGGNSKSIGLAKGGLVNRKQEVKVWNAKLKVARETHVQQMVCVLSVLRRSIIWHISSVKNEWL